MFSALKKLVGSEQAPGRDKNIPAGLQSMNQALQRRFAKGVQYNSECKPGVPGFLPGGRGKWGPRARAEEDAPPLAPQARAAATGRWQRPGRVPDPEALGAPSCPRASRSAGGCGRS